jgi:protein-tyrosine phosphatase
MPGSARDPSEPTGRHDRGSSAPWGPGTVEAVPGFVDIHSHVVPSGDDGVQSVDEGVRLCREAARRGTRVLYATPHVWAHLPLTTERERAVQAAFPQVASTAGLELRLGYELAPARWLLREELRRYALAGTDAVLVEVPFVGPIDVTVAIAELAQAQGLTPVIAHPERGEEVDLGVTEGFAELGWLLQVNTTSLLGRHGEEAEELAWRLLRDGTAAFVASDGHREARPPYLDAAFELARAELGAEAALRFFDGTALEAETSARRLPSRAASRGA